MEKMASDGPKWGQEDFFLLIQTLPTFWAERILIWRIFIFCIFLDLKFPDFWVPDFQISSLGPGLGQTPPPDEFSDPNLTPLPTHPGIKYVARTLAATYL